MKRSAQFVLLAICTFVLACTTALMLHTRHALADDIGIVSDVAAVEEQSGDTASSNEDALDVSSDTEAAVDADVSNETSAQEPVSEDVEMADTASEAVEAAEEELSTINALGAANEDAEPALVGAGNGTISYTTHVQNIGWQAAVTNGSQAGTTGKGLRLEGIKINLSGFPYSGGIRYRVHVQNKGNLDWVSDGSLGGTTGQALRLEAIWIELTGDIAKYYDVSYRVHVQNIGWQGWVKNGDKAGTSGRALRLEAIEIKVTPKSSSGSNTSSEFKTSSITPTAPFKNTSSGVGVQVNSHVQNIGWQGWKSNGETSGTSGQSLRIEALQAKMSDGSKGISYRAYVQGKGWQDWVSDGVSAGSTGQGLRMEAVEMQLSSSLASKYNLYYRVYVQNRGWLEWKNAANNSSRVSGLPGQGLRIEAIQVVLKDKVQSQSYIYLDAGHGMGSSSTNVLDTGALGSGYKEYEQTSRLAQDVAKRAYDKYGVNVYVNDYKITGKQVNFRQRQTDAYNRGCTSFVSIHFNAVGNSTATGSESYIHSINAAAGSNDLQSIMHGHLIAGLGLYNRGMRSEQFAVCGGKVPATLLEICFITNPNDMKTYKARYDKLVDELAQGLYEASKAGF